MKLDRKDRNVFGLAILARSRLRHDVRRLGRPADRRQPPLGDGRHPRPRPRRRHAERTRTRVALVPRGGTRGARIPLRGARLCHRLPGSSRAARAGHPRARGHVGYPAPAPWARDVDGNVTHAFSFSRRRIQMPAGLTYPVHQPASACGHREACRHRRRRIAGGRAGAAPRSAGSTAFRARCRRRTRVAADALQRQDPVGRRAVSRQPFRTTSRRIAIPRPKSSSDASLGSRARSAPSPST